jgi:hypothetical protein
MKLHVIFNKMICDDSNFPQWTRQPAPYGTKSRFFDGFSNGFWNRPDTGPVWTGDTFPEAYGEGFALGQAKRAALAI